MLIELIVCIAVISYMRKHNSEPGFGHNVFQTTIAPILRLSAWAMYCSSCSATSVC